MASISSASFGASIDGGSLASLNALNATRDSLKVSILAGWSGWSLLNSPSISLASLATGRKHPSASSTTRKNSAHPITESSASIPIEIHANEQESDPSTHKIYARGDVRILSNDREFRAPGITADTLTQDIDATGGVSVTNGSDKIEGQEAHGNLKSGDLTLSGDVSLRTILAVKDKKKTSRSLPMTVHAKRLDYNLTRRDGDMTEIETQSLGFRFKSSTAHLFQDQRIQLVGAEFSVCPMNDKKRYGYTMRAKSVDVVPQNGAVAHRATLYIDNTKITTLSHLKLHSGDNGPEAHLPMPRIGHSSLLGDYINWGWQQALFGDLVANSDVGLTTYVGARFATTIRPTEGGPTPFLRLVTKEEVSGRDPKRLLIDRLPEFGYLIDNDSNTRLNQWVRGEVSLSSIRQVNPSKTTGRASLTLFGNPIKLKDAGPWRLSITPGFHEAAYNKGDHYQDVNGEIAIARRWNARRSMKFGFAKHFTTGETPFVFDEALVPTELNTQIRWSYGAWGLKLNAQYDLDRHELFDAEIGIGHVIRCLEPRLVYRYRVNEIGLEINLVGLGDIDDLPASETPRASVASTKLGCADCGDTASSDAKKAMR